MAIVIGCDLHSRFQQVAVLCLETGEVGEYRLEHEGDQVRQFYGQWREPVTVAIEATGYSVWFAALMAELGHQLRVGERGNCGRWIRAGRRPTGAMRRCWRRWRRRTGFQRSGFRIRRGGTCAICCCTGTGWCVRAHR